MSAIATAAVDTGSGNPGQDPELTRLRRLFQAQREAFQRQGAPDVARRKQKLERLQQALLANSDALTRAVDEDYGHRCAFETRLLEIFGSVESIRYARRRVASWARPQRRSVSLWFIPARNRVEFQPLGVVGIIAPFNYPIYLAIGPLVGALAAGNRALIKLSEFTPRTGEALRRVLAQAFSEDEVAVIGGETQVAQAFSALPFDHLLFTGSIGVGKQIMQAASENLTPVTLELGGKSPAIIGADADWQTAVRRIMVGKLFNAGQTCVAPDYVLLPQGREQAFVETARQVVAKLYPEPQTNPDYTAIINQRHYQRLEALLADAADQGAELVELGGGDGAAGSANRKLSPTLVLDSTDEMVINQEELFGPILPVLSYRDLDQAIAYINRRPRPLALYYFGSNKADVRRVLDNTVSGGVAINETLLHAAQDALPFGGVGASGMGCYHGREGFETFSKKKSVMYRGRWSSFTLLYPPYGNRAERLLKLMLGR